MVLMALTALVIIIVTLFAIAAAVFVPVTALQPVGFLAASPLVVVLGQDPPGGEG